MAELSANGYSFKRSHGYWVLRFSLTSTLRICNSSAPHSHLHSHSHLDLDAMEGALTGGGGSFTHKNNYRGSLGKTYEI